MKMSRRLFSILFSALICCFIEPCSSAASQESDRVTNLPGQPTSPPVSHFSGYITVNQHHGRALFYWFFHAQSKPSQKPLLLWLNGGPGCSSIGYGAAVELGPLRVNRQGKGLEFNKHSWTREANLLFVESPVGVGFSYTNTSTDFAQLNDKFVAEDAYTFLVNWFERFPQFKTQDFYIAGESYAGHYVPQLADLVYDRNKNKNNRPFIKLKGFIVGNPETQDYYDFKGILEYAWSHAIISDQLYKQAEAACDFSKFNWSDECNRAMSDLFYAYNEIDIYNIYAPTCLLKNGSSTSAYSGIGTQMMDDASVMKEGRGKEGLNLRRRIPGGYDPCFVEYTQEYFNRVDVRLSLHANTKGKWEVCSKRVSSAYNVTEMSIVPVYVKLIKAGLKIWVYSGDVDGRVPVTGTRYWTEAMGLPLKDPWRSWYHNHQVGGRIVEYQGLTLVTVRGAGHLVPLNKPGEALALIHSYLSGHTL